MEMNATSRDPENQQGMNTEKLEKKDGEDIQQCSGEEWQLNAEKKSFRAMTKDMKRFLWNPETRECMGRTSQSWGRILLFYLVFYSFLAGMFAFCLYILLLTISPYTPTYRDRVSPPGVMIRPHVKDSKLCFNISDQSSWMHHVNNLNEFLKAYDDTVQEASNIACTPGQYFMQDTIESAPKLACQFKRSFLGNCSGIKDPTFGYSMGEPCILLKMNRLLLLAYRERKKPVSATTFKRGVPPEVLLPRWDFQIVGYQPGYGTPVTVSCKLYRGEEYFPEVEFYPNAMFDLMYYPYYGKFTHVNYTSPLVAIQFRNVRLNHTIPIQCQLNGVGIINDYNTDKFLGRVIVRLTVRP